MKKIRVENTPVIHPNGTVSVAFLRKEDRDLIAKAEWMEGRLNCDWDHHKAVADGFPDKIREIHEAMAEWLILGNDQTDEYLYSKFENVRREKNPNRGKGRKPRTHRD
jgi:hypothetical protein